MRKCLINFTILVLFIAVASIFSISSNAGKNWKLNSIAVNAFDPPPTPPDNPNPPPPPPPPPDSTWTV